jgi:hypothetical protein
MPDPLTPPPDAAAEPPPRDPLAALWRPSTVRARSAAIAQAVEQGRSGWFTVEPQALEPLAGRVAQLVRERFPDGAVPRHSRWRHFQAGGVDRVAELDGLLQGRDAAAALRARLDLTVISVLLDAGAGASWGYDESRGRQVQALALPAQRQDRDALLAMLDQASGGGAPAAGPAAPAPGPEPAAPTPAAPPSLLRRSEGLAVASLRAFLAGAFSGDTHDALRADARTLGRFDAAALRELFQVGAANPLTGLEGRAGLLQRLGALLERSGGAGARPSALLEPWLQPWSQGQAVAVDAAELLSRVVSLWAPIWSGGSQVLGLPAGDVWPHLWAGAGTGQGEDRSTGGWVPFHKLSQWLVYSLLEPLEAAGLRIVNEDALTALPEYRNGGLLLDGGVIVPRDRRDLAREWTVGDTWVVEWRALTVHLIDQLAPLVRAQLSPAGAGLSLAALLEGGTWAAGRALAAERREGGAPPVRIASDGTVF